MKKIVFIFLSLTLIFSCKKSTKNNEITDEKETVELTKEQVKIYLDSTREGMNQKWDSLIAEDDKMMNYIKRLIDEVSFTASFDEEKLKLNIALYDSVLLTRYTLDDINDDKIDVYDEIQMRLISSVNELAETTPDIESHPLAIELMNDIAEIDGMMFSTRADYDIYALQQNKIITDYPDKIKELGVPYVNYKTVGTFEPEDGY